MHLAAISRAWSAAHRKRVPGSEESGAYATRLAIRQVASARVSFNVRTRFSPDGRTRGVSPVPTRPTTGSSRVESGQEVQVGSAAAVHDQHGCRSGGTHKRRDTCTSETATREQKEQQWQADDDRRGLRP